MDPNQFYRSSYMKKNFLLACLSLVIFAVAVSAQDKMADYSGTWALDVSKSKLDERMRVESMTLTVAQTDKDITVTSETKRPAPPVDASQGGGGRPSGMGGGDGTTVYGLDGKETTSEVDGLMGKTPVTLKAKSEGGKLNLSKASSFSGPMGEMTMTTKETWELAADGKSLMVTREQSTPRGATSSTLVFSKK